MAIAEIILFIVGGLVVIWVAWTVWRLVSKIKEMKFGSDEKDDDGD